MIAQIEPVQDEYIYAFCVIECFLTCKQNR